MYTRYLPLRPKFWSDSLYTQRFPRYRTFYHTPLPTMLNAPPPPKKKEKNAKNQKFEISQFFIQFWYRPFLGVCFVFVCFVFFVFYRMDFRQDVI